jgi:hypothetical protein
MIADEVVPSFTTSSQILFLIVCRKGTFDYPEHFMSLRKVLARLEDLTQTIPILINILNLDIQCSGLRK